jgi:hypothetical protein
MADAPAGGIYVTATSKGNMTVYCAAATEQAVSLVVVTLTIWFPRAPRYC